MIHQRFYRNQIRETSLIHFQVVVAETDLSIHASKDLSDFAYKRVSSYRNELEKYINAYPAFATTLAPWTQSSAEPKIVQQMIHAGNQAGIGPMSAVAGVIAEMVGDDLRKFSDEIIVENGGDLYIYKKEPFNVGIYAGASSPFSNQIGIRVDCSGTPLSICTSSSVIGHSLSFGEADAVTIIARSGALADAVATATGNRVKSSTDIDDAINFAKKISGVDGVLILIDKYICAWGSIEMVAI